MIKFNRFSFLALVVSAHVGLAALLFWGSGAQIFTALIIFFIQCSLVSTAIYHRLFSHRSWNAPRWLEAGGALLGIFTFTGTPITRTLAHRYHHKYAESDLDPHSPKVAGIFMTYFPMLAKDRTFDYRMVLDMLRVPLYRFIHKYYFIIILAVTSALYFSVGLMWTLAVSVAPGALCWMNISTCNIFCHLGKDPAIVNNRLLSIITFGEGWHRNHHDFPDSANFGKDRLDIGYMWIKLFEKKSLEEQ